MAKYTWVAGNVVFDDETHLPVLVTLEGDRYPLPSHLYDEINVRSEYRLARVALDSNGIPSGSVLSLNKRINDEEFAKLLAAWKLRNPRREER